MPGPEFWQTGYGRRFFDVHVPAAIEAAQRIAIQLERAAPHTVKNHCANHGLFECGKCEAVCCMGCRMPVIVNAEDTVEIKTILRVCPKCFPDERVFQRGGPEHDAVIEIMRRRTAEPLPLPYPDNQHIDNRPITTSLPGLGERARDSRVLVAEPRDTFDVIRGIVAGLEQEVFVVVAIDVHNKMLGAPSIVAQGTVSGVEVHPRDVFRSAIRCNAAGIVLAHNHPSGDPAPSHQDIELTKRLREVGAIVGIPVIDHVVIGGERWTSIAEHLGDAW